MPLSIDPRKIQETVQKRYARVSRCEENLFRFPTGRAGAILLGYAPAWLEAAPAAMLAGFCGVGNPFAIGPIKSGDMVLDVGCGAGFDLFCASRLTGPHGRVAGIDPTPEMVACARSNLAAAGVAEPEVRLADAESIPYPDHSFTVVISNGALNLAVDKERTFSEIYRVLQPGGRLQLADVVLARELPPPERAAIAWAN
jgi:arsenite methyltransferase